MEAGRGHGPVARISGAITTPIAYFLARSGDLAAQARVAAATYGPLPSPTLLIAPTEALQQVSSDEDLQWRRHFGKCESVPCRARRGPTLSALKPTLH